MAAYYQFALDPEQEPRWINDRRTQQVQKAERSVYDPGRISLHVSSVLNDCTDILAERILGRH